MKHQPAWMIACLAAFGVCQSSARAESLWARRHPQHAYLFYDTKARNVGDLVTVIISQNTDVDNREDRGMEKSTQTKGLFDFDSEAGGGFGDQGASASLDFGTSSSRKFDGGANYSSAQGITDRVTTTVMDVLPNGNMVIAGKRRVRVAGEERTLVVTGVVRSNDLSAENAISSQFISEFTIGYESAGTSQKFTRQGWLGRVANKVWPF